MNHDSPETKAFFDRLRDDTKKSERQDLMETLAMAAIAYWAYGTVAHAVLFAFLVFAVGAVGNRVVAEMRRQRAQDEARRLQDRN